MRNNFVTEFWREAHQSLPAELRGRYLSEMQAAERWELTIARLVESLSGLKQGIARLFQTPKSAH